jgi:hypothetical protein
MGPAGFCHLFLSILTASYIYLCPCRQIVLHCGKWVFSRGPEGVLFFIGNASFFLAAAAVTKRMELFSLFDQVLFRVFDFCLFYGLP